MEIITATAITIWLLTTLTLFVVALHLEKKANDYKKCQIEQYIKKHKPSEELAKMLVAYKHLNKRDKMFVRYLVKYASVEDLACSD